MAKCFIVDLPYDCLVSVFSFLSPKDLAAIARTCQAFYVASCSSVIWRRHCLKRWAFCNVRKVPPGPSRWRVFFLEHIRLDVSKGRGRASIDYVAKSLRGHTNQIADFVFVTPNCDQHEMPACPSVLASCGSRGDQTVRAWNAWEGNCLWTGVHSVGTTCLASYPKQQMLVSGDLSGTAFIWNIETGQATAKLHSHVDGDSDDAVTYLLAGALPFSPSTVLASFQSGSVRVWDSRDIKQPAIELSCQPGVNSMQASPHQPFVVAAASCYQPHLWPGYSGSSNIEVWDFRCGTSDRSHSSMAHVCSLQQKQGQAPSAFAWLPWKAGLLAAGCGSELSLFSVKEQLATPRQHGYLGYIGSVDMPDPVKTIEGVPSDITTVAAACEKVIVGCLGGEVCVVNVNTGLCEQTHRHHQAAVTGLAADTFRALSCSKDYSIRAYTWYCGDEESDELSAGRGGLHSRYTLLGGSLSMNQGGFRKVLCDYNTCVGMGEKVLKAYLFKG